MAQGSATGPRSDVAGQRVSLRSATGRATAADLAVLLATAGLAAVAVAAIHLSLRMPGHAILKPMLPMAIGLSLVPRRFSGTFVGLAAALIGGVLLVGQWGEIHLSALTSLVLLGPALDVASSGTHARWLLVGRFAAAGLIANMAAMGVKVAAITLSLESGGRGFVASWPASALSFAACGVLAGLLGSAICLPLARNGSRGTR
jgi:hypothetical protein